MAKATNKKKTTSGKKTSTRKQKPAFRPFRWLLKWTFRAGIAFAVLMVLAVLAYSVANPKTTPYMLAEGKRNGDVDHQWVNIDEISPFVARSVVAAEDANYCLHWGFDMDAIRDALDGGSVRGASTISQQVVKNAYLWQGRSWLRKALEAIMTPMVEAIWTKRRILEVYLNIVEFGDGVFGIEAASRTYFRKGPGELTRIQAARLAAVLPNPKQRSASNPSSSVQKRARSIADGAATIQADGRSACFES